MGVAVSVVVGIGRRLIAETSGALVVVVGVGKSEFCNGNGGTWAVLDPSPCPIPWMILENGLILVRLLVGSIASLATWTRGLVSNWA